MKNSERKNKKMKASSIKFSLHSDALLETKINDGKELAHLHSFSYKQFLASNQSRWWVGPWMDGVYCFIVLSSGCQAVGMQADELLRT